MKLRRQTVDTFRHAEAWMGSTHFLIKRLPRVSTEMSLHALAYNLKRVMQILAIAPLMQAMRARPSVLVQNPRTTSCQATSAEQLTKTTSIKQYVL